MHQFVSSEQATERRAIARLGRRGVCPYVGPDALVWAAGR